MVAFIKQNKIFVAGVILLGLLLFKNPLSGNNFISELEPSPDSIHYLNPLVSLLGGKGLAISYKDSSMATNVPPLYSLTLFPIYFIFREIRFFYITNVLFTIISAVLFYKIITKLFVSKAIKSILFFGFVTNYIVFWYPQVAMAENLLIPLYLLSIWLLIQPLALTSVLLLSFLAVAFFATKYIAWVLSLSLIAIFIIKVKYFKTIPRKKYLFLFLFFLNLLILSSLFAYIEYLNKGINMLSTVIDSLQQLAVVPFESTPPSLEIKEYYSKSYMAGNFIRYLAGIMGGQVTVLQKDFILLPIIVGMTSIPAIFVNLFTGKNKLLSFYFFISITGMLYFISIFYIVDARYLFVFIPVFFLIFGIFLETLSKLLKTIYLVFVYLMIVLAMLPLSIGYAANEIKLNFFQPEKAKNYEAIKLINKYTTSLTSKPLIISTLSPYMIDFYSNHKYGLLPLSKSQYFISSAEQVWGIKLKPSLTDTYNDYLIAGRTVLVSAYQTGDKYWFGWDMDKIKEKFNLLLVERGCDDKCNLYRLEIKNN